MQPRKKQAAKSLTGSESSLPLSFFLDSLLAVIVLIDPEVFLSPTLPRASRELAEFNPRGAFLGPVSDLTILSTGGEEWVGEEPVSRWSPTVRA